jgi:hypothetical protein
MNFECRKALLVVAGAIVALAHGPAALSQTVPTQAEVPLLPKFCWGRYMGLKEPEFNVSHALCGWGTNHYCGALTDLLRADRSYGNSDVRLRHLLAARNEILYTLNNIKTYPNCPIRSHAENSLRIVEPRYRALGGK